VRQLAFKGRSANAHKVDVRSELDFNEAPILHQLAAITRFVRIVPIEFRNIIVLNQLPFEAHGFALTFVVAGMEAREAAYRNFSEAIRIAGRIQCTSVTSFNVDFAL